MTTVEAVALPHGWADLLRGPIGAGVFEALAPSDLVGATAAAALVCRAWREARCAATTRVLLPAACFDGAHKWAPLPSRVEGRRSISSGAGAGGGGGGGDGAPEPGLLPAELDGLWASVSAALASGLPHRTPLVRELWIGAVEGDTRDVADVLKAAARHWPRLQALSITREGDPIRHASPLGPALRPLARLSGLRELSVCGVPLAEGALAPMAGLSSLTKLRLVWPRRPDQLLGRLCLAPLAGLARLREVQLSGWVVWDVGGGRSPGSGGDAASAGAGAGALPPGLVRLEVGDGVCYGANKHAWRDALRGCTRLELLSLRGSHLSACPPSREAWLSFWAALPHSLERVDFNGITIRHFDAWATPLPPAGALPRLRHFGLTYERDGAERCGLVPAELAGLPRTLRSLAVSLLNLQLGPGHGPPPVLPGVTRLRLGLTDDAAPAGEAQQWDLSAVFPSVRSLRLPVGVPEPAVAVVAGLSRVERLEVRSDHADRALALAAALPSLRLLQLEYCHWGRGAVAALGLLLSGHPCLQRVRAVNMQVHCEGMSYREVHNALVRIEAESEACEGARFVWHNTIGCYWGDGSDGRGSIIHNPVTRQELEGDDLASEGSIREAEGSDGPGW